MASVLTPDVARLVTLFGITALGTVSEVAVPHLGGTSLRVVPEPMPQAGPSRPAEAPMSLTASDGTGLRLVSLNARAVVDEPLAFTELKLAFQNPQEVKSQFSRFLDTRQQARGAPTVTGQLIATDSLAPTARVTALR